MSPDQSVSAPGRQRRPWSTFTTLVLALVLGLMVSGGPSAVASALAAQDATLTVDQIAAEASPAVVTVTNLQRGLTRFSNDLQQAGMGSGFIVDAAGHVVTNNHVVAGGEGFIVTYADGTEVPATLVGSDPFQDVAVLQLDLSDGEAVPGVVTIGDLDDLAAGDLVVAIGNPYGEHPNAVSEGTIAAIEQALDTGAGYLLADLLEHNAPIYPGNSGGPLLDETGAVIGMNVAKAVEWTAGRTARSGPGYAIEIDAVMTIVTELVADGTYERPFLGIVGEPTRLGQRVVEITTDGPAEDAGLAVGDVITAVEGETIDADHPLANALFAHEPGESVTLTVIDGQNGTSRPVDVLLDERPLVAA